MTAQIAGFRSRDDLGLAPPRSFSTKITPASGGAAVHWGGPAPRIRTHADCESTWRGWQSFHMRTRGWVDIAYTAGFCQCGFVLAGRGLRVRTAANGTNAGNQNFYAFVWVGGQGMTPTQEALDALDWLIHNARQDGAGMVVWPHRVFTGSSCPGINLVEYAKSVSNGPIGSVPPEEEEMLERGDKGDPITRLQWRINQVLHKDKDPRGAGKNHGLVVDGVFGEATEEYVHHVQHKLKWKKYPGKVDWALGQLLHELTNKHTER